MTKLSFRDRLIAFRKFKNFTQQEAADYFGIPKGNIVNYELRDVVPLGERYMRMDQVFRAAIRAERSAERREGNEQNPKDE